MSNRGAIGRGLSFGAFVFSICLNVQALDMNAVEAELSEPITLLLQGGNRHTGEVKYWNGESLRLEIQLGAGSAEMTVPAGNILDITFPGTEYLTLLEEYSQDPERVEESLTLFRAFFKQRGAYLQFMDPEELDLFIHYTRYALENNKPLRAVAVIEVLRPHIKNSALLKSLDDSILLAFFLGGLEKEAEQHARKWIKSAGPADESALGWRILSEIYFAGMEYEDALWTALHPVAFANQKPMQYLNACYAFAIAAANETRQLELSKRLTKEMTERGLSWPGEIKVLAEFEPKPDHPIGSDSTPEERLLIEALRPIQTPSPLDPEKSLPTRVLHQQTQASQSPL